MITIKKYLLSTRLAAWVGRGAGARAGTLALSMALVLICAAALLVFAACAGAPKSYAPLGLSTDRAPLVEGAYYGTLPNGLRYYILERHASPGEAFAALAVNAGSAQEPELEQGYAYLAERIVFDALGPIVENNAENSGQTGVSLNSTVFKMTIPLEGETAIPERILNLLNDLMQQAPLSRQTFDAERAKMMAALGQESRQDQAAIKKAQFILRGSPYAGRANVLGLPQTIENCRPGDIERFYKTWYRPDNMAIIFVGDFDGAATEESIKEICTAPAGPKPFDRTVYELPTPIKNAIRTETFADLETNETQVDLFYKRVPQKSHDDIASFRESLIDDMLLPTLRSYFNTVEGGLAENIAVETIRIAGSSRYCHISFIARGGAEEAIAAITGEQKKITRTGLSDEEIENAKNTILSELQKKNDDKDRVPSSWYRDLFLANFLKSAIAADERWNYEAAVLLLPGIAKQEINQTLRSYFSPNDLSVFITTGKDAAGASMDHDG